MKKQLLCTSAIALGVAAAAPASAQDWNLDWGGFYNQHLAFSDVSDTTAVPSPSDYDGLNFHSNSEIIFSPSVTLDNGLTFGINVQLEAHNTSAASNYIDEAYMTISGDSLGRIVIGSENSAGYLSMVAAPEVTSMGINSPSISAFIPLSNAVPWNFRQAGISAYTEVSGTNDVQRLTYYTPNFNGFVLGVSYARNNVGNALQNANNNVGVTVEDIFDIGVNYSGSFGGTDVSIGARWGTGNATAAGASDPETWGIGAQVGFGAITVGASYAENTDSVGAAAPYNGDQSGWSFGATFDAPGPWSFEALTYQGEFDLTAGGSDEYEAYRIGASRDLGPGVDWDIYVVFADADANTSGGGDVDGTVIGTAINLSF